MTFLCFCTGIIGSKAVFLHSCKNATLKQKDLSPFCWATLLWKNESLSVNLLSTWCLLSSLGAILEAATTLSLPGNAVVPNFLHTFWVLRAPHLSQPVFAHFLQLKIWCGKLSCFCVNIYASMVLPALKIKMELKEFILAACER